MTSGLLSTNIYKNDLLNVIFTVVVSEVKIEHVL